ncbi:MAG TPA: VOC family protein [Myxococcaceae bacterium]|nr:VOC family protein [Myxococcaceae bacterium]
MTQLRICIDVDDLEKAITFYTEALGLKLGRRFGKEMAELLGGSSSIDLLVKPAGSSAVTGSKTVRSYQRHWTPVHLDFVVRDIDTVVRRAQALGAVLEGGIQGKTWGRIALMADPFGHGFCLLEFQGAGYDALKPT